jgi:hypothetical protein
MANVDKKVGPVLFHPSVSDDSPNTVFTEPQTKSGFRFALSDGQLAEQPAKGLKTVPVLSALGYSSKSALSKGKGSAGAGASGKSAGSNEAAVRAVAEKQAWALAQSPVKSVGMMLFMSWMSGAVINIFSIMICFYLLYNPLAAIVATSTAFAKVCESGKQSFAVQKALYVAINAAIVMYGLYKAHTLGLLPTTPADVALRADPPRPWEVTHEAIELL